ncbi:uncharacterized protein NDAI_0G05340 [Naumovozyma dairenensis CBS 421]|uniref:Uncharacterized protein n=1 Tax=Naumovozyma dairenensis (strain ATCC 10597 / BCRC 20456 / CBS 421 / NBRC 0211 / NRRL Y-12639) TaxID=1071378 RepID=J7RTF8_NAUDC|nr:hypothetical protein NDAI_0G05340 [Naumovozyma dairenensis CBS 421]CCK73517.1 hypothetical protein NDAI_0G05340 [Naumovozyma dairenensis CBS 421]
MGHFDTMSSNDQLSHLGKSLTLTASALLGSHQNDDRILTQNSQYKTILHSTVNGKENAGSRNIISKIKDMDFHLRDRRRSIGFQDLLSAKDGEDFFKNQITSTRTSFKVLSHISDELLSDIPSHLSPENKSNLVLSRKITNKKNDGEYLIKNDDSPSLFQGFEGTLAIINNTLDHQGSNTYDNVKLLRGEEVTDDDNDFILPNGFTQESISRSYSLNVLRDLSEQVIKEIDLFEIQKKFAENEINDIDSKIKQLKFRRKNVFNKIARMEKNEFLLMSSLETIKERTDFLKEYGLEATESDELSEVNSQANEPDAQLMDSHVSEKDIFILSRDTNTDHDAIQDSTTYMDNEDSKLTPVEGLRHFFQNQNKKFKRIIPKLQHYYDEGSLIASLSKAHSENITCLDFDVPFGTLCTAGHMDNEIKVWNLSKKKQIGQMRGHLATINCMEFDNDYNMLVSGGKDALLKLWDLNTIPLNVEQDSTFDATKPCIYTFDSHIDEITALSLSSETLISGSQDRTLRQWDVRTGKHVQTMDLSFITLPTSLSSKTTSPEPYLLSPVSRKMNSMVGGVQCFDAAVVTGTKDGIVRFWDLRTGKVVRHLEGHTSSITCLKFDSKNIITGSTDKTVRVWDIRMGTLAGLLSFDTPVLSLDFDTDKIAIGTYDESVKVYDRHHDEQWACREDYDNVDEAPAEISSKVETIRYKNGYLVDGRTDGTINTWAI